MRFVLACLVVTVIACESDDRPARTCDAPDGPAACLCSAMPPTPVPVMPVDECTAESVAQPDTEGLCCENGDRTTCGCAAIGCYRNEVGICTCGPSATFAGEGSAVVASCAPGGETQRCCLDVAAGSCRCSPLACDASDVEVDACDRADVLVCGEAERVVDACT